LAGHHGMLGAAAGCFLDKFEPSNEVSKFDQSATI